MQNYVPRALYVHTVWVRGYMRGTWWNIYMLLQVCTVLQKIFWKRKTFFFSVQIEVVNTVRRLNKFKRPDFQVKTNNILFTFWQSSQEGFIRNCAKIAGLFTLYKFKIHIVPGNNKNRIDRTQNIFQSRYQNNITLQIVALTNCNSNSCSLS